MISTILLVATVVIIAATISVFVLGFGENVQEPGPVVGQSTAELEPVNGSSGGIITVTHVAGDQVEVENMEVIVDASDACGKRTRVVNLPASFSGQYYPGNQLDESNFEGNENLLAEGFLPQFNQEKWDARLLMDTANDPTTIENTFSAGNSFQLRIAKGGCNLDAADKVSISVVHTQSNSIILDKELTV
ncbi:type IV pilin N-terminal domain-containing protein [Halovenus salina]|uniref:type IV pilin N-terminal domain-containing protein n=1 Tax=Halovenus salina TaxID=1510225 RepID=UPI0022609A04|nr:type IV pilin [Halovenus salina]